VDKKLQFLRKPEGFRDLLPREAGLKRCAEDILSRLFAAWGYREVVPSTVEYSSIFTAGMKADFEDKLYRFSDERGRTLVLRPDLTLPLARIVAAHMQEEPLPLRFFYQGSIFRYLAGKAGRQREFYQAGVELLGEKGPLADGELLALAAASLKALGIQDAKLCLGNLGFVNSYLERTGLAAPEREQVKHYLSEKDLVGLETYVEGLLLSRAAKEDVLAITRLKGGREVLAEAAGWVQREDVGDMQELFTILEAHGVTGQVLVDLGLVRGLDYYTGIVFEGYTSNMGSPICGGGRYDQLLQGFGRDLPAVGFAFHMDHVLLLLSRQGLPGGAPAPGRTLVAFAPGLEGEACRLAARLREAQIPVEMALKPMDLEESRRRALAKQARHLKYLNRQGGTTETREEEL
jgi:ATP phosphoribosyltransferase regulatory subunit